MFQAVGADWVVKLESISVTTYELSATKIA